MTETAILTQLGKPCYTYDVKSVRLTQVPETEEKKSADECVRDRFCGIQKLLRRHTCACMGTKCMQYPHVSYGPQVPLLGCVWHYVTYNKVLLYRSRSSFIEWLFIGCSQFLERFVESVNNQYKKRVAAFFSAECNRMIKGVLYYSENVLRKVRASN